MKFEKKVLSTQEQNFGSGEFQIVIHQIPQFIEPSNTISTVITSTKRKRK